MCFNTLSREAMPQ